MIAHRLVTLFHTFQSKSKSSSKTGSDKKVEHEKKEADQQVEKKDGEKERSPHKSVYCVLTVTYFSAGKSKSTKAASPSVNSDRKSSR